MKKSYLFIFLATIVIFTSALLSCFIYCSKVNSRVQVLPLYLSLRPEKTSYRIGESVTVMVTIENVGKDTLIVNSRMALGFPTIGSPAREIAFHIITPSKRIYELDGYIDNQPVRSGDFIPLERGKILEHDYRLDTYGYHFTEEGIYKMTVDYLNIVDPSYTNPNDDRIAWKGMLTSNEILIDVTP